MLLASIDSSHKELFLENSELAPIVAPEGMAASKVNKLHL